MTRTEYDGTITVLAERYQGKRLNSPNDVVVRSEARCGSPIPPMASARPTRAARRKARLKCNVYGFDRRGSLSVVADDFRRPNGLAFSPDEKLLSRRFRFLADPDPPHHIRAFEVADGRLKKSRVIAEVSPGIPDGFRVDIEATSGRAPATAFTVSRRMAISSANFLFRKRSPMSASVARAGPPLHLRATSLYAIHVNTRGAQTP